MAAAGGVLGMAEEQAGQGLAEEGDMGRMEDGGMRLFRVSVDVRSFRAGSRLPARAVNAFVRVVLPHSIVKLAMATPYSANAAKLTAPLRTHPPVLVAKGTEIVIPNGYVALELPATISALSAALAEEPHIVAQVLHSDRYMADSVIGVASIPMASLLHDSRLDGYAPVFSPLGDDGPRSEQQVNIGAVRVVLALEELGPVMEPPKRRKKPEEHGTSHPVKEVEDDMFTSHTNGFSQESFPKAGMDHKDAAPCQEQDLRQTLEYEMAWEFEMWRRSEEAKWRADLKEREMVRMAALEAEWRKRERAHLAEMERTRKEQDALENKLKTKMFELEKMQRKLVQGQESAKLRRDALEREFAQRVTDAQVAVKRLQTECEHRVELEQGKYTALLEQHAVLEKRLATANKALTGLEKQFSDFKAAQRNTFEADLSAQVLVSKQQCNDLNARLEAAVRSKEEYKTQVLRMAKEMATFYRDRLNLDRGQADGSMSVPAYATMQTAQNQDLDRVGEQLRRLQVHEQTAVTAATAAAAAVTAAVSLQLSPPPKPTQPKAPARPPAPKKGKPRKSQAPGRRNVETAAWESEDDGAEPMFAKPATENSRLGTPRGNASDQLKQARKGDGNAEEPRGPEARQPLLEVGQSRRDPYNEGQFASRRLSDVENELVDEEGPLAPFKEKEIRRLKKQKAELLDSGVYSVSDRIIRGLDMEIRRLEAG